MRQWDKILAIYVVRINTIHTALMTRKGTSVSSFHDDALVPFSNDSYWHNRKEAKAIRKSLKKYGC